MELNRSWFSINCSNRRQASCFSPQSGHCAIRLEDIGGHILMRYLSRSVSHQLSWYSGWQWLVAQVLLVLNENASF